MRYPILITIILPITYKLDNFWLTFTCAKLRINSRTSFIKLYTSQAERFWMMNMDSEIIDVIIIDGRHYYLQINNPTILW